MYTRYIRYIETESERLSPKMKNQIWIKRATGETVKVLSKVDRLVMVQEGEGQRVYFLSLFKTLFRR